LESEWGWTSETLLLRGPIVNNLCDLAAGGLDRWRGLTPFQLADAPACLGAPGAADWYQKFGHRWVAYRAFRGAGGDGLPVTHLFVFGDSLVHLAEVYGAPVGPAELATRRALASTRASRGEPEALGDWPLANELQRPLMRYGEVLREYVFGDAGLALLVGECGNPPTLRLARLRGFEPMAAQEYREHYMVLPAVEFFPES
jgi:hypothetical protein